MRVLVLGVGGMAGHVIALHLREQGYTVDTLSARNRLDNHTTLLDVTDHKKLEAFLRERNYNAVVNCIALLVRQSEEQKDLAVLLNAHLPHFLEQFYASTKTQVVHISTDGVFGSREAPHKEDEPYEGQGFYDRPKALGEIINDKDANIRTSIFGPDMRSDAPGLFNWFWAQSGEISGYDKVFWSGISTIQLARAVEYIIKQRLHGVLHLEPTGISKFDLLQLFKRVFGRSDITIKPNSDVVLHRVLQNTRKDFDFRLPNYTMMVEEMKAWIEAHPSLYKHYA